MGETALLGAAAADARGRGRGLTVLSVRGTEAKAHLRFAARGLSNREIGAQLYLSHRTVGSSLYRVFPKLGVHSRAQLRVVLPDVRPAGDLEVTAS